MSNSVAVKYIIVVHMYKIHVELEEATNPGKDVSVEYLGHMSVSHIPLTCAI